MSISRWIYEPFYTISSEADRAFEDFFPGSTRQNRQSITGTTPSGDAVVRPRLDLYENPDKNSVTATFELPGLKKDDIKIEIHNNVLTVSGEASSSTEREDQGYAIRERRFGKFGRSVQLPQGIKHDDIKASMDNGVLTVMFPKTAPEAAPKKITIS